MHRGNERYRVGKLIGQGATGYVHLGEDVNIPERKVAIKRLTTDAAVSENIISHIKGVATIPAHTNLVPIYSFEKIVFAEGTKPLPAIVMELVDGGTLQDRLNDINANKKPQFTTETFLKIARGILSGLKQMHDHSVPHCDMHAGNVLLGADDVPRLIDPYAMYPTSRALRATEEELHTAMQEDVEGARALINEMIPTQRLPKSMQVEVGIGIVSANTIPDLFSTLTSLFESPPPEIVAEDEEPEQLVGPPDPDDPFHSREYRQTLNGYVSKVFFKDHDWDGYFMQHYSESKTLLDLQFRKDFPPEYLSILANFTPMAEQYTSISLIGTLIDDSHAEPISKFRNVIKLRLGYTRIGEEVVRACMTLPHLESLELEECDVAFLDSLTPPLDSPSLDVLSLSTTNATSDSLAALTGLKKLRLLELNACENVTSLRHLEPLLPQNGGNLQEVNTYNSGYALAHKIHSNSFLTGDRLVKAVTN